MIDWRRNLAMLWICQVLCIMGFSFALPFAPLYIQELGVTDQEALRLWSGLFTAGAGVPLAIMMPVWGFLSDRWGRKPMTLRASLAGALILLGMSFVKSTEMLLVLRFFQGVFTGTMAANLTLVVSNTPQRRMGFAIGIMNAAVFTGNAVGPLIGGTVADLFGFRTAFRLSSLCLFLAFFVALFWVKEEFHPQVAPGPPRIFRGLLQLVRENRILAFIGIFPLIGLARFSPRPMYPLLVKEIAAPGLGIATQAGIVNAAGGIASVLAGILVGRLADRKKPYLIGMICAVTAGIFLLPQGFAPSVWALVPLCFLADFFSTGVEPIMNVLLSRQVPAERRGAAFGLSASARSLGWAVGSMSGGALAAYLGFAAVFINAAILFFFSAFYIYRLQRRREAVDIGPADDAAPLGSRERSEPDIQSDDELQS